MSALCTISLSWPFSCQKLSDLVNIWQSCWKNNFDCFLRHGVLSELYPSFHQHNPALTVAYSYRYSAFQLGVCRHRDLRCAKPSSVRHDCACVLELKNSCLKVDQNEIWAHYYNYALHRMGLRRLFECNTIFEQLLRTANVWQWARIIHDALRIFEPQSARSGTVFTIYGRTVWGTRLFTLAVQCPVQR